MKNNPDLSQLGEFGLHRRIQEILGPSSQEVLVGIGDDCAVVQPRTTPMILTKDAMVENVHFKTAWTSPQDLAYKALASNVSDLAAKAAQPAFALIALGLPSETSVRWIEEFYQTLADLQNEWGIEIIGGDTVRSPHIFVSITAIGYQTTQHPIRTNSACVGDKILVTGTLGDAAAGLEIIQSPHDVLDKTDRETLIARFLRPTPRLMEVQETLKNAVPSSMTDVSDGLGRDLPKICKASSVGAEIDADRLPQSNALRNASTNSKIYAWKGGEDYEILFTLAPDRTERLLDRWDQSKCPLERDRRDPTRSKWNTNPRNRRKRFNRFRSFPPLTIKPRHFPEDSIPHLGLRARIEP